MNKPKVLIGAVIQESNTFGPARSTMDNFRRHRLLFGEDVLHAGTENELSGFMRAASTEGIEVIPTMAANAVSSGMFTAEALEQLKATLLRELQFHSGYNGVYFAMHGAMVAEGCDDVEGCLMEMIRSVIGDVPFVVSLDLHANVTDKMASVTDGIVGFRTYPHTDFVSTGMRSAALLFSMLRSGRKPVVRMRKIPMIVPAENSQSSHGPFAELWQAAEEGERLGNSWVTSLFPVQPWLDIEEMGCAVVTVHEDEEAAEREADRLADLFWQKRHEFHIRLYSVREVVKLASERQAGDGPFVISDSADSPGAGSTGDSNYVLRELLSCEAHLRHSILLTIVDAPAVARAIDAGEGQSVELEVGYSICPDGEPLRVCGRVRHIGDGRFTLAGGYAKGTEANMGRCVVLELERLSLLITERPTFSGDPSMYRSVGLEPAAADIVLVKSANQFRADYEAISKRIFLLDTPGRSPADLRKLVFNNLRRPCYPFDDSFDWRNPQQKST
ncbi:M81 family metallopeptidase [Paenibacillus sp. J2TS4]|uniref:M81 family metallopeptidase n=1 Tax=Paenibacillus sp. J2TS4 TaxID=2807194 RepID=UPI001B11C148|nr:M81 family metallopeptidase [Paenibacillus sp. J2TS4]GIP33286.1 microcystinase C [Paenibacillus sp. J2TS4]